MRRLEVVPTDPQEYEGGITLQAGTVFAVRSEDGVCSLLRIFGNGDGGGTESWALEPEEMVELGGAMQRAGRAAQSFHAVTVATLRARDMDGEA